MKHYINICLIALSLLTSCNDYLDTIPSKGDNEVLNSSEQIEALFNNNSLFNAKASMIVAESDDNGMSVDMYDSLGYASDNYLNGFHSLQNG